MLGIHLGLFADGTTIQFLGLVVERELVEIACCWPASTCEVCSLCDRNSRLIKVNYSKGIHD